MSGQTTERAFETYVEEVLLTHGGWKSGSSAEWDKDRALSPKLWMDLCGLEGRACPPSGIARWALGFGSVWRWG